MSKASGSQDAICGGQKPMGLRVLLVADGNTAELLQVAFAAHGHELDVAFTFQEAVQALVKAMYDVVVIDHPACEGRSDALLERVAQQQPNCACLMLTNQPDMALAADWMKRGAYAYLLKPFEAACLVELCNRARLEQTLKRTEQLLEERTRTLRESEARMSAIFDAFPGMLHAVDLDLNIIGASKSLLAHAGLREAGEALGRKCHAVWKNHDTRCPDCAVGQVLATGKPHIQYCTPEEAERTGIGYDAYITPIRNAAAQITGAVELWLDVSKRLDDEKDKARLRQMLTKAQKMESVGQLAGGIAHDFNNMLGVILGHADLALMHLEPENPMRQDMLDIHQAAQRAVNLTRQLLAYARKQAISPKVLNITQVIDGMRKMLQRLLGNNIELEWLPGENPWPVLMDPSQIDQVIMNLVVNARDAIAGEGKITISSANVAIGPNDFSDDQDWIAGEYVRLIVRDNGTGMDQATLAHIFEPFFTTKGLGRGTGLGLATVYGMVKQNYGHITVSSAPKMGTEFMIYLPRYNL